MDKIEELRDVSTKERKNLAGQGKAMPDGSFPIANVQDLKNAIQAIGRAKDPAAAKAHIKKRARALGHPELIPEGWAVETDEFAGEEEDFARGPGWVTNPEDTRRLHSYWTQPGHAGYEKVRWGTPGDFTRLRRFLSKYIPATLLNRVTAQWHHDAVGFWPGEAGRPGNPPHGAHRQHLAEGEAESVNLVAAALEPISADYFDDPQLEGPQGLIVDGDHVYGHIATWGTCHVGIKNVCTTAPKSKMNYGYFRTGAVHTDKGKVSVGQLTLGTGHAALQDGPRAAASHYDNTGTVVADVAAGEDEYGIWVAGKVRDGASPEQVHALQAGSISGDWRAIGGSLELIAALVVNVPGFPVPRPSLAADAGEQISLVAAGVIEDQWLDAPDIKNITTLVLEEMVRREQVGDRIAALRASVESDDEVA